LNPGICGQLGQHDKALSKKKKSYYTKTQTKKKFCFWGWALMAHACNSNYSEGKKNFFAVWGLELRAYTLKQPFFVTGLFRDRVSKTICTGWL
jgi:hypothetical protein